MVVRVATEIAIGKNFDYLVPEELESSVRVGSRVKIPFGKRMITGDVVEVLQQSETENLKSIISVVGELNLLTPKILDLAKWISGYYCCPLEITLRSLLPVSVRKKQDGWKKQLFVREIVESVGEFKPTDRQKVVLDYLQDRDDVPVTKVTEDLRCSVQILRNLEKLGAVKIAPLKILRDPYSNTQIVPSLPLTLNEEQQAALDAIKKGMDSPDKKQVKPFLLFGVTGSGKTEVYLQAIAHALQKGEGAIVLVPEISLTPQTVERFKARFSTGALRTEVAVLHSHLSDGERHDEWHKIRRGIARIVIGARSAVFAPVDPLGLIIVDEEHEYSYKQEEAPRYNARDIAVVRGLKESTAVILGSATPCLESYYNAKHGKYTMLKLSRRVDEIQMPDVQIVDMRHEFREEKGIPFFSVLLREKIRRRLELKQQTILFLNRRGYATLLQCPQCGYTAYCPNCSIALTYHRRDRALKCHICDYQAVVPVDCPDCHEPGIAYLGVGTERVEDVLRKLFPDARIGRMDADTLKKKTDYRKILSEFGDGKIDILLGTQMIAKGLHFPRVTLVGILYADVSLHRPDFRASERTFNLITQVAGRAGRGNEEGEVVIQTFTPYAYAISYARNHDYENFYMEEMEYRSELEYPPLTHLVLILLRSEYLELLEFTSGNICRELKKRLAEIKPLTINGPVLSPLERAKKLYRYQILLRTPKITQLSRKLTEFQKTLKLPKDVIFTIDVDPVNMN